MNELLSKDDIIERISEKLIDKKIEIGGNKYAYKRKYHLKYSKVIIKNVLDAFWNVVADALSDGDSVWIYNYIKIEPKYYKEIELKANGFKGMETNIVPARYKAKFKMGERLKKACKQLLEKEQG